MSCLWSLLQAISSLIEGATHVLWGPAINEFDIDMMYAAWRRQQEEEEPDEEYYDDDEDL